MSEPGLYEQNRVGRAYLSKTERSLYERTYAVRAYMSEESLYERGEPIWARRVYMSETEPRGCNGWQREARGKPLAMVRRPSSDLLATVHK